MRFIRLTNIHTRAEFAADLNRFMYIERILKVETGVELTRIWLADEDTCIEVIEPPTYIDPSLALNVVPEQDEEIEYEYE